MHIPTLREDPADAGVPSHRLLLRAGYIRQLAAGHYSLLPLAVRVRAKVIGIIREEMDRIGAQELLVPIMHPAEIWQRSGRWDTMADVMFRLTDHKGAVDVLSVTNEEVFTVLAQELNSHKQLPQAWYQFQTKLRDEPRPRAGLLRVREFTMKDSYSFDLNAAGLDISFDRHRAAYVRIFERLSIPVIPVEASSGAMGGRDSTEFMCPSEVGEDMVAYCPDCNYAANVEKATSALPEIVDRPGLPAPERFATPGVRTIEELATGYDAPADRQIKTLVTVLDAGGQRVHPLMGCYGIGVERAMAAIVECYHDDRGIVWPLAVAPFSVVIVVAQSEDTESAAVGESLYGELSSAGVEVIIDDRAERAGVKFRDAELTGIPLRVTVGKRGLAEGVVEVTKRATGETVKVGFGDVLPHVREALTAPGAGAAPQDRAVSGA
jgi:prolyl-tRNA synthetase